MNNLFTEDAKRIFANARCGKTAAVAAMLDEARARGKLVLDLRRSASMAKTESKPRADAGKRGRPAGAVVWYGFWVEVDPIAMCKHGSSNRHAGCAKSPALLRRVVVREMNRRGLIRENGWAVEAIGLLLPFSATWGHGRRPDTTEFLVGLKACRGAQHPVAMELPQVTLADIHALQLVEGSLRGRSDVRRVSPTKWWIGTL